MRTAQKSKLKHILNKAQPTQRVSTKIIGGGALLWCCYWKKNEQFHVIFGKYTSLLKQLEVNIVVFDGYNMSTKDARVRFHKRRKYTTNTIAHPKGKSLSNYTNKENFVMALATKLD